MKTIYRCGYCGIPTNEKGGDLDKISFEKNIKLINGKKQYEQILVHGDCCVYDMIRKEQVQVTRDMAIDAGCPEIEGQWIDW